METNITNDMIAQAKKASSVEELLALAKENGIALNEERAQELFSQWHENRELSDDELDSVSGGCGGGEEPPEKKELEVPEPQNCPHCGHLMTVVPYVGSYGQRCENIQCQMSREMERYTGG